MESVKQRISELTYTGVQSLRGEFELACLRELVAVTEQRDALVLENALIDSDRLAWAELYGDEMGDPDVIEKAKALSKPATDAAIAALRAEGVEMFAKHCSEKSKQAISSDTRDNWWLCGEHADDFALQLRESKGEVQS